MDASEITRDPLGLLLSGHIICQGCHIVDTDPMRGRVGYPCPICGRESEGGWLYFSINIPILIDLMQESYHTKTNGTIVRLYEGAGPHDISVVIYFCALREILLDKLIMEILIAKQITEGVRQRLLSDNKFHIQKQDKLFYALTGKKWKNAVKTLNEEANIDFVEIDKFISKAVDSRNDFIHEGSKWSIDRELSTSCMNNIKGLINLYVGLHNNYVHPIYKDRIQR